ncbi:hypothetical protein DAETH_48140 (plasmid) [Deinococcus aetherius]|uniref:Uncharacterized protein n=1 Tax=Deinococcus aetherius TaxID=200252 RepID=A0ABM8ALW8_9DEIO|nr:hypothetical protein [Deinococcus aetherius]BDP44845.1 hypothetical protein DAETH_48140 [Deinococcus aetherius]
MIWRDAWEDAPGVVVMSEHGVQQGKLHAVVLALRLDALPAAATLTNEHGAQVRVRLPRDVDPFSINTRIPLTVEVTT